MRPTREPAPEKPEAAAGAEEAEAGSPEKAEGGGRGDKKRDRRRNYRRRRGRDEAPLKEGAAEEEAVVRSEEGKVEAPSPAREEGAVAAPSVIPSLLPPPPTLISETIARYKDNALFKGAFYTREEVKEAEAKTEGETLPLAQPDMGPLR